jgi:hypothetical protein
VQVRWQQQSRCQMSFQRARERQGANVSRTTMAMWSLAVASTWWIGNRSTCIPLELISIALDCTAGLANTPASKYTGIGYIGTQTRTHSKKNLNPLTQQNLWYTFASLVMAIMDTAGPGGERLYK